MTTTKIKNTWRKTIKVENKADAYYTVTDRSGFTIYVLSVPKDPRKPFAGAICLMAHPSPSLGGYGNTYVTEIPGLVAAWLKAHTPTDKNTDPIIIDHGERTWDGTYPEDAQRELEDLEHAHRLERMKS